MQSNQDMGSTCTEYSYMAAEKFRQEVLDGLASTPKRLSSKYFYDEKGDRLFQRIMTMPGYYLTGCELDIFRNKTPELFEVVVPDDEPFDLIELGAGDGVKSSYLIKYLMEQGVEFTYMPIDISGNILNVLVEKLRSDIPEVSILSLEGEYYEMLDKAASLSQKRKVVLFLGSNIGNMELNEAYEFGRELNKKLSSGDIILIGFDLRKNPHTVLNAYNDKEGITAAFNLNLLTRINRELDADFDIEKFQHYQTYDPESGACRSYLISLLNQNVRIGGETISFVKDELIYMEVSQKFSKCEIREMAEQTGFEFVGEISDSKGWFLDAVWRVV